MGTTLVFVPGGALPGRESVPTPGTGALLFGAPRQRVPAAPLTALERSKNLNNFLWYPKVFNNAFFPSAFGDGPKFSEHKNCPGLKRTKNQKNRKFYIQTSDNTS